ncbi:hypothetical protein ILYODFUR_012397, partial [Ilyodon furcidens]
SPFLKGPRGVNTMKQEPSHHEDQGAPNKLQTKLLRSSSQGGVIKKSKSLSFPRAPLNPSSSNGKNMVQLSTPSFLLL